jgi:hypothetical protein
VVACALTLTLASAAAAAPAVGTFQKFPHTSLNDGGMAYVSTKGLQGIYAIYGQHSSGFARYVTRAPH